MSQHFLSHEGYATTERNDWVLQWPGQVVLCVNQIYWTAEVERALRTHGSNGVAAYLDTLNSQLKDVVGLVR